MDAYPPYTWVANLAATGQTVYEYEHDPLENCACRIPPFSVTQGHWK